MNNTYIPINVVFNFGNTFFITNSDSKLTYKSAKSTLIKIEYIVAHKLKYDVRCIDNYSQLSRQELLEHLENKAWQICLNYNELYLNLNRIKRKFVKSNTKLCIIFARIQDSIRFPRALPFPDELIQEIFKHLKIFDLNKCALLNRHGKIHADFALIARAEEFGSHEKFISGSKNYIVQLFQEVLALSQREIIPRKYHSYRKKKFQAEDVLQNLKLMSEEDFVGLLQDRNFYKGNYQEIYNYFKCNYFNNFPHERINEFSFKGYTPLILAVRANKINAVKFLLQNGANVNTPSSGSCCSYPLHWALNNEEIINLLLKNGAVIDSRNPSGKTPLILGIVCNRIGAVKFLLNSGADPNLVADAGKRSSPLQWAVRCGRYECAELLLENGADINFQDADGNTALTIAYSENMQAIAELLFCSEISNLSLSKAYSNDHTSKENS